jgi:hypothetical protein
MDLAHQRLNLGLLIQKTWGRLGGGTIGWRLRAGDYGNRRSSHLLGLLTR